MQEYREIKSYAIQSKDEVADLRKWQIKVDIDRISTKFRLDKLQRELDTLSQSLETQSTDLYERIEVIERDSKKFMREAK